VTREVATPVQWVEQRPLEVVADAHGHAEACTARRAACGVIGSTAVSRLENGSTRRFSLTAPCSTAFGGALVPAGMGDGLGCAL